MVFSNVLELNDLEKVFFNSDLELKVLDIEPFSNDLEISVFVGEDFNEPRVLDDLDAENLNSAQILNALVIGPFKTDKASKFIRPPCNNSRLVLNIRRTGPASDDLLK
jgi:hypothetical protein